MKNPPAFQLYPQDFLADLNVQAMTDEEVGIYCKALFHCWIENGLEIGCPLVEGWFNQHPTVRKCFYEKDGFYRNQRLDEERAKQINWAEKSRKGGLHSAEKKRHSKGGLTKGQPKGNQRPTLQSSSSSSSSIKKQHPKKDVVVAASYNNNPDPQFSEKGSEIIRTAFKEFNLPELLTDKLLQFLLSLSWEYREFIDLEDAIRGKLTHWIGHPLKPKANIPNQFRNWFRIAKDIEARRRREGRVGRGS